MKISAGLASAAGAGAVDQSEQLREALLKLHQSSSVETQALRARLRELDGADVRAAEKTKEVEALVAWQQQAKQRMEELTQVDSTAR